jgi:hypothetical protein
MPFNLEKCKVMHVGRKNPEIKFILGDKELSEVSEEVDLGVLLNNTLKVGSQCAKAAKSANKVLGLIFRTVSSRSAEILLPLYKALVRPQMEYCVQVWKPYLRQDIAMLEKVQKRYTKRVEECRDMKYEKRLEKLELISFEERCNRADLVLAYKILRGKCNDNKLRNMFIVKENHRTRGNSYKLFKKRCRTEIRRHSFANRVVDMWNKLPDSVIEAKSVETFKSKIVHYQRVCGGPI